MEAVVISNITRQHAQMAEQNVGALSFIVKISVCGNNTEMHYYVDTREV